MNKVKVCVFCLFAAKSKLDLTKEFFVRQVFKTANMISTVHIDPIHRNINLPEFIENIINTEEFQRLRNLKQLGLSYWLFPGAIHTRYEHCIG